MAIPPRDRTALPKHRNGGETWACRSGAPSESDNLAHQLAAGKRSAELAPISECEPAGWQRCDRLDASHEHRSGLVRILSHGGRDDDAPRRGDLPADESWHALSLERGSDSAPRTSIRTGREIT